MEGPPPLHGLTFRRCRGEDDFPAVARVSNISWEADLVDLHMTAKDLKDDFERPVNFDPAKDMVIAEIDGRIIGMSKITWKRRLNDLIVYCPFVVLLPEFRGHGIRRSLLRHCEVRAREVSSAHPAGASKFLEVWSATEPNSWKSILGCEGYSPSWDILEMVRDGLDRIPELPLPPGIEVRPVRPQDVRKIWDAAKEALRDDKSFSEENWGDLAFEKLSGDPRFTPELWQIAWDSDEVVGGVHNFIDRTENEGLGRKWGHTEHIFVRRRWRNRGIAKALIARSLKVIRDAGMDAATLDVDAENPSRALQLYEGLGFRMCRQFTVYRKGL
ncbi:MAG: hypothetical protein A3K76_05430 [Euryarchaeota archaeon RBG_13_57_23]|nr:MAG: hypothetical protein A3K76_05430 [Euryarchaeota archaeon RBG_13_57_23]